VDDIKNHYQFSSKLWRYPAQGGWHFISLPKKISKEIRSAFKWEEEGWGRLKATARIGNSEWNATIWFDTKMDTYLLPIKAEIRKKEALVIDQLVNVVVSI
jgi:hypothetical protein